MKRKGTRALYHVKFFGSEDQRAWINQSYIKHWQKNTTAKFQFDKFTKLIRETAGKSTKKSAIKSTVFETDLRD